MTKDQIGILRSTNRTEVLDRLWELGASTEFPDAPTLKEVISLLSHSDADIRERAAFVAGIHFRCADAYWPLLRMLRGAEQDQCVLHAVIRGAVCILTTSGERDSNLISALALLVLDPSRDPELRATAYTELQRHLERITVVEYAAAPESIEDVDWDIDWVKSLLSR